MNQIAQSSRMINPALQLILAVIGINMIVSTFIFEVFKSNLWLDVLFCALAGYFVYPSSDD